MKRWTILIVVLFVAGNIARGQNIDSTTYKFSAEILDNLRKDTTEWRYQNAATDFAFSGQHKQALLEWDTDAGTERNITKADSLNFIRDYNLIDARNFIRKKAEENQIIIFNEAHYNPRNRVFVTSLLSDLKNIGYTYFAAEALSRNISLSDNKSPTFNTGYYTKEPEFGNLIREARNLNYNLYPYEVSAIVEPKEREIIQAQNLASLLKANPQAKIIIYCGFAHILEDSLPSWGKAMAGRLKEFTGIDPYTIDQIELSEHTTCVIESPFYRILNSSYYSILVNKKDENNPFHKKGIDALLYSPRTKYIFNRPDWIFENGRRPYFIKSLEKGLQFPILAKVYLASDDRQIVIPIDVIEIETPSDILKTAISLPKTANVIIVVRDKLGKTQTISVTNNRS